MSTKNAKRGDHDESISAAELGFGQTIFTSPTVSPP
jgi:hypothetical protein